MVAFIQGGRPACERHGWFASLEPVSYDARLGNICDASTTYRVVSGRLPPGVTLDTSTGAIRGNP
jgi:hypothetical protein